ncbi:MAG: amidohydrolase family protein [Gammaproteobacteria bacterium]|nr:amidohydrolase family protein [Gammaproteobacteria bacterium]
MSNAAELRASLDHPVIDADGHWLEFGPVLEEAMGKIGGEPALRGLRALGERVRRSLSMTVAERRAAHVAQEAFWGAPTKNTRDRATAMMPKLLYERLPEFGIDFSILFPTGGLGMPRIPDTEARIAACRAFNRYQAELFAPYADRMTPAAVIPMHTPDEALAELDHAVGELGMKVIMLNSMIERPVEKGPEASEWYDVIGLDSAHDYDPVWQRCAELRVSPTFHRGSRGRAFRMSPSNFCYNHIGHFAAASEAVCKAIFLGGVTARFPQLNFAFLEGGVGFACLLYADLIGHWAIRNRDALSFTDPANLDMELLGELATEYADERFQAAIAEGRGVGTRNGPATTGHLEELDDYAACRIEAATDFLDLFVRPFYFGCEADDPTNAWAFNREFNPCGAEIKTLFGSDIGHFDVQEMAGVLPEAYELVEDGKIDHPQFRRFVFENPVRFWGEANPSFFEGTVVADAAGQVLAD